MSRSGVGWSWGIPGFRIGKSADGTTWISVGIPGTGLYFTKRLRESNNPAIEERHTQQARTDEAAPSQRIKRWRDIP